MEDIKTENDELKTVTSSERASHSEELFQGSNELMEQTGAGEEDRTSTKTCSEGLSNNCKDNERKSEGINDAIKDEFSACENNLEDAYSDKFEYYKTRETSEGRHESCANGTFFCQNYGIICQKECSHRNEHFTKQICQEENQKISCRSEVGYAYQHPTGNDYYKKGAPVICSEMQQNICYPEELITYDRNENSEMEGEILQTPNYINQLANKNTFEKECYVLDKDYSQCRKLDHSEDHIYEKTETSECTQNQYLREQYSDNITRLQEESVIHKHESAHGDCVYSKLTNVPYQENSSSIIQNLFQKTNFPYQLCEENSCCIEEMPVVAQPSCDENYISPENSEPLESMQIEQQESNNHQELNMCQRGEIDKEVESVSLFNEKKADYNRGGPSAVDLRVGKMLHSQESLIDSQSNNNDKEPSSLAQLLENFYPSDFSGDKISSNESYVSSEVNIMTSNFIVPEQICNKQDNMVEYSSQAKQEDFYIVYEGRSRGKTHADAETNTEPLPMINGCQYCLTNSKETKDASVQTDMKCVQIDMKPRLITAPQLKNVQYENVCPYCKRIYTSKYTLDRHIKTHNKGKNKIITNVQFTTEAKLQICKKVKKSENMMMEEPIIIEMPRPTFWCSSCQKKFQNRWEKDNHDCILAPFQMKKCPECHVKFYTQGCLNQHREIAHKVANAYYCVFCSESFSSGYDFHIHLDKHLSV